MAERGGGANFTLHPEGRIVGSRDPRERVGAKRVRRETDEIDEEEEEGFPPGSLAPYVLETPYLEGETYLETEAEVEAEGPEEEAEEVEDPLAEARTLPLVTNLKDLFIPGKKLGAGYFGVTYLVASARDPTKKYALKILRRADPGVLAKEIGVLKELSAFPRCKRRIACYHTAFAIPTRMKRHTVVDYAILTDFVPGSNLSKRVRKRGGPLPGCEAIPLFRGLLKAVELVHRSGYAHRDIKPENVVASDSGDVVLIDFGLACMLPGSEAALLSSSSSRRFVCRTGPTGDAKWAAPEQKRGGPTAEGWPAADIWSTGATMFFVLSGVVPRSGYERVPAVGSCMNDLLEAMMSDSPRARPTAAEALGYLDRCAESECGVP